MVGPGTMYRMSEQGDLFGGGGSEPKRKIPKLKGVDFNLWTRDKARLISEYLHRFLMVTRHGIYIDGFAGPQEEIYNDDWAARLVLNRRDLGPQFRKFLLCDAKHSQVELLKRLRSEYQGPPTNILVYQGDFNVCVHEMLADARIGSKDATFCLLDQRTFECYWHTVQTIAKHKSGYKIEQFYFLGESWIDRAKGGTQHIEKLDEWWGNSDYDSFFQARSVDRALLMRERFEKELGYEHVTVWSIHAENGRTMYYMIHASDHPRAPKLMNDAYAAARRDSVGGEQSEMFSHLFSGKQD